MRTGQSVRGALWFVMDLHGRPGWYSSSKVALRAENRVIGIAGVRYPVQAPQHVDGVFRSLAPAIQFLEEHFTESVSIKEVAERAGLSSTHLNRQFKSLLGMSPTRFLHAMRVDQARLLLETTQKSILSIALETGYWDQSHFTRYFTRLTGITPRKYRQEFRRVV